MYTLHLDYIDASARERDDVDWRQLDVRRAGVDTRDRDRSGHAFCRVGRVFSSKSLFTHSPNNNNQHSQETVNGAILQICVSCKFDMEMVEL